MLCSLPSRAQALIVEVVKRTFAAASSACASPTVIQSLADGIGQSPLEPLDVDVVEGPDPPEPLASPEAGFAFDDDVEPPDVSVPDPELEPEPPSDASSLFEPELFDEVPARRSFFAQPEPLKWIAGAANTLRTGPLPHNGQLVGPSSWRPWMTSNRRPQAAQM